MTVAPKSGRFDECEDAVIRDLVSKYGARNWSSIAAALPGRTARQCRDRYCNYLAPDINQSTWTDAEEKLLNEKHQEFGSRWTLIAQFFQNRSTNCLKNHWNYKATGRRSTKKIVPARREKEVVSVCDEVVEKIFPSQDDVIHEWDEMWPSWLG